MLNIDTRGVAYALLWVPILFVSILFHEFAHATAIGLFGFGPSEIVLQGVGGVTINQRRAKPWQDLLISAAGPASSFLLAWIALFVLQTLPVSHRDPFLASFLPLLRYVNNFWGIFNLMPVMPLDGYGVVRNLLRMFLNERKAFTISIWISMIVGALLAILALVTREFFALVLFLWFVRSSYMQWQFFRSIDRTND